MPICVLIKELKDTVAFAERVEQAQEPVIVTKHGREVFISMSLEVYENLRRKIARSELYGLVDRGLSDIEQGRVSDARDATGALRERYGLRDTLLADEARRGLDDAVRYIVGSLHEPAAAAELLEAFDEFTDKAALFPEMYPLCAEERLALLGIRKPWWGLHCALSC